jgi:hypothetical protein
MTTAPDAGTRPFLTLLLYGVVMFGSLVAFVTWLHVRRLRHMPRLSTEPGADDEQAEDVRHAAAMVRRGARSILALTFLAGSVVTFGFVLALRDVSVQSHPDLAIVIAATFVFGLPIRAFIIRRWWRRALADGADPVVLVQLAEEAGLAARSDNWIGRWQRRTWLRLPSGERVPEWYERRDPDRTTARVPPASDEPDQR